MLMSMLAGYSEIPKMLHFCSILFQSLIPANYESVTVFANIPREIWYKFVATCRLNKQWAKFTLILFDQTLQEQLEERYGYPTNKILFPTQD